MEAGIYRIDIGPYFYYGRSKDVKRRCMQHMNALRKGTHHNRFMQRAYEKYKKFAFEPIVKCDCKYLPKLEAELVQLAKNDKRCMNLTIPDENGSHTVSEETKRRISESRKGIRQKSGHDQKWREHMRKVMTGRVVTEEWRERISRGKSRPCFIVTPGGFVMYFDTAREASEWLGCTLGTVSDYLAGRKKWPTTNKAGCRLKGYTGEYTSQQHKGQ